MPVFTCRYIWLFFAPRMVCFCPTYHFWKHFLIGSFRCIIINITYKFFMILKENIMNFHLIPPSWLFDFWRNIYKPKSSWLFFAPLSSMAKQIRELAFAWYGLNFKPSTSSIVYKFVSLRILQSTNLWVYQFVSLWIFQSTSHHVYRLIIYQHDENRWETHVRAPRWPIYVSTLSWNDRRFVGKGNYFIFLHKLGK